MADLVLAQRRVHSAGVEFLRRGGPYIGLQERPKCLSCPVEQRTVGVAPSIVRERGLDFDQFGAKRIRHATEMISRITLPRDYEAFIQSKLNHWQ